MTKCETQKVASGQDLNCSSDTLITHCHAAKLQVCTVVDTSESEKVSVAGTALAFQNKNINVEVSSPKLVSEKLS